MKKSALIVMLLVVFGGIFEFYPAVEYQRDVVPEEIYVGKNCDCDCILRNRPWYSRLNYWFWLWVIATPVIVFSVKPATPRWQRALRTLVVVCFCYGFMNLALHLMWDIRNGPFIVNNDYPWQKSWDIPKCANIADGASIAFMTLFGWLYAMIYIGWWEMIWYQYHKRKTELLTDNFKRDWISRIVVWVSVTITVFIIATAIAFVAALMVEKFW